jgi:hypothetical protein
MPRYHGGRRQHRQITRAAFFVVVLSIFATGQLTGPWAGRADAQVNPAPPTTSFLHVQLSGASPMSTNYSYIGTFWVQYRYGSSGLDWWFRLAPKWVQEAGTSLVTLGFTVTTRGKKVNNYQPHEKPATYFFHSSMGRFQFDGDAFWTDHRLHVGDTVDISTDFSYAIPAAHAAGLHTVPAEHSFWAHYRVGIR